MKHYQPDNLARRNIVQMTQLHGTEINLTLKMLEEKEKCKGEKITLVHVKRKGKRQKNKFVNNQRISKHEK